MKLEQLRTFLSVVEHGSFTRASEALHLSQSTVSFQIAALEVSLGSKLLDRRRGSVRPTPPGKLLAHYAARMWALAEEATRQLHAQDDAPAGRLSLAASTIVAEYLLPPILRDYRAAHPHVSISVQTSDSRVALEALAGQRCDVALVGTPVRDRRFDSEPFAHDDIVLVGPFDGARTMARPAALASLPLVLREQGSGTRKAVAGLLAETDLDRANVLEVGSTEAARRCVAVGLGYAFISRHAIEDDLRERRVRIVKLPGTPVGRDFHIARLRTATPSSAARALHALVVGARSRT